MTMTDEKLAEALRFGWEGNPSDLVDEDWCWVTEAKAPAPPTYGPTYTVHRVTCTRIDHNTTYLRPIRPNDETRHRCDNCS